MILALRPNANWYGSKENQEQLQKKLAFFKKTTNYKIVNYYDKGNFCSGFAKEHVVIEANGCIFAISDDFTIYRNVNNKWEEYNYANDHCDE